jgi:hypothetical protein
VYENARHPAEVTIAGEPRWLRCTARYSDVAEPTKAERAAYPSAPLDYRWETEDEFRSRRARDRKCAEDYKGNHDWRSPLDKYKHWNWWFDVRRAICVAVASAMLAAHIGLLV